jgi:hypothetical protein
VLEILDDKKVTAPSRRQDIRVLRMAFTTKTGQGRPIVGTKHSDDFIRRKADDFRH